MSLQCIFLQTTTLHCAYNNSNKIYDLLKESTISHLKKKKNSEWTKTVSYKLTDFQRF